VAQANYLQVFLKVTCLTPQSKQYPFKHPFLCTTSEVKTEPDPSACSPSRRARQQQQAAGCGAVTGEDGQQPCLEETTSRKDSSLALSPLPGEL